MKDPKFNVDFKDGKVSAGYDGNSDGEQSVTVALNLKEIYGELMDKGEAQVDIKKLSLKREGTRIIGTLDTDQDGEPVGELRIDLGEALEEAI